MALLGTEYRYRFYKYQQVKNVAIFGVSQDCKFWGKAGGLCSELNYPMTKSVLFAPKLISLVFKNTGLRIAIGHDRLQ
jgi:hypothetical protein